MGERRRQVRTGRRRAANKAAYDERVAVCATARRDIKRLSKNNNIIIGDNGRNYVATIA